jgi:TnpA family transposase
MTTKESYIVPVELFTPEQEEQYGKFVNNPTLDQLAKYFLIDDHDYNIIFKHRHKHNKLGFAVQLGTVRFLGTFLGNPIDVPENVVSYIGKQLKIDVKELELYISAKNILEHRREICEIYGYRSFNNQPDNWRLIRWLYNRAWLSSERPVILFDLATNRCVEQKILLPGVTTLERLVAQICDRSAQRLWKKLSLLPNSTQREQLNNLVTIETNSRQTKLDNLRHPPTVVSPNGIIKSLERLKSIRFLGASSWNISRIPIGKIRKLSRYVAIARAQIINRMPEDKKFAHLVAFAISFTSTSQDDVIDILDKYLSELFKRTNSKGDKNKLRTSKVLSLSMRKLLEAFEVLLDETTSDEEVRAAIFAKIPKDVLKQAFHKVDSLTKSLEHTVSFHELFQNYTNVRKFLPFLLESIDFKSTISGQNTLNSWDFIKKSEARKQKKFYKNAPIEGISDSWQSVTKKDKDTVYACGYTFWVLDKMHQAIKNREVYICGSGQYDDPNAQLLQGESWASLKLNILNTTKWSSSAAESINPLVEELDEAFKYTSSRLKDNEYVRFEEFAGKQCLILTPLERREETKSYKVLNNKVKELLPTIELPILALEVNKWTGFFDCFTHINGGSSRVTDLEISICAIMIARACNIGLEAVVQIGVAALEYDRLTWVEQNYFRSETIELARIKLNEFHSKLTLSQKWGKGEVASADGTRLIVPVKSITPGHNSKYFGVRKGITNYSLISDMFDELNFLLQSGASKDSIYLPQCVLEQPTSMKPKEIMTDTGVFNN